MTVIQSTTESDLKKYLPATGQVYKRGQMGGAVKFIQEWLWLHQIRVVIDGDYGLGTEAAVRMFQKINHLETDGIVGIKTYAALVTPMAKALQPIKPQERNLNDMVIAYALQHIHQRPREVGGQNRGTWVRLYMKGSEGGAWPWCAGFVSLILRQAAAALNVALPLKTSFSCDLLAAAAKTNRLFLAGEQAVDKSQIPPGSLFLIRGQRPGDWVHTGFVVKAYPELMVTIEGNTNGDGSREGNEVWQNIRRYKNIDFITLEPTIKLEPDPKLQSDEVTEEMEPPSGE